MASAAFLCFSQVVSFARGPGTFERIVKSRRNRLEREKGK